jgi:Uma2 family endonuclease
MVAATAAQKHFTLEEFMANPLDQMEWVDGKLVEKDGVTLKHGKIQSRLGCAWANYRNLSKQEGEVYISPPCCTNQNIIGL